MVGVADGDRQRIGGIGGLQQAARQQATHHHLDLRLLGMAGADDRLLDQVGGIFGDREPGQRRHQQRHAACEAELQRGRSVLIDEGLFDRGLLRLVVRDHLGERVVEFHQPLGHRAVGGRMDRAVGDVAEARAIHIDHAPAGVAQPRIETEQADHAVNRAMTSSATSKLAATVWTSSLSSSTSSSFSRDSAASAPTATLLRGRQLRRASCGDPNLASSASRTAANCSVAHTTSWTSASLDTSSAPASSAASNMASALAALTGKRITPLRSNMKDTLLVSPRWPPAFEKAMRISEAVRLRLSVSASTMMATPPGP